ncbi:MAG: hypothetical protein NVSMB25_24570 [Thermoleophilaceae bacterium]
MNSERAQAYGRVKKTVDDLGASKLFVPEMARIRAATDALFFAEDLSSDGDARAAVSDITELCRQLVDSGRWLDETARELLSDVLACGPLAPVA